MFLHILTTRQQEKQRGSGREGKSQQQEPHEQPLPPWRAVGNTGRSPIDSADSQPCRANSPPRMAAGSVWDALGTAAQRQLLYPGGRSSYRAGSEGGGEGFGGDEGDDDGGDNGEGGGDGGTGSSVWGRREWVRGEFRSTIEVVQEATLIFLHPIDSPLTCFPFVHLFPHMFSPSD